MYIRLTGQYIQGDAIVTARLTPGFPQVRRPSCSEALCSAAVLSRALSLLLDSLLTLHVPQRCISLSDRLFHLKYNRVPSSSS